MSLTVHTARLGYRGPDWLDVSRQGNVRRASAAEIGGHRGMGLYFAPSYGLLTPYISRRRLGQLRPGDWEAYAAAYTAEMRSSYRRERAAWDALLRESRVVLLCFCTDASQCHRRLLAGILSKLGATDAGEVTP